MPERGDDRLALGERQPLRRDGLDVEVAAAGVEVAERGRAHQPDADEPVTGDTPQAHDELLQVRARRLGHGG